MNGPIALLRRAGLGVLAALCLAGASSTQAQIVTLTSFTGANGANPYLESSLTLSGSTLYGTTYNGGASSDGTVFSLPVAGGTPTTLATFTGTANGANPGGSLLLSGSTLYGVTARGGANGFGTVFSLPAAGGTPTTLATFTGIGNGRQALGSLTLSGGTLYGTTFQGGAGNAGTVFSLPVAGGTPTTLVTFNNTNGANPYGGLTLSGSTLYGSTSSGGANSAGTVFSLPVGGGTLLTLASFNNTDGGSPAGSLTLIGSTLYGTTFSGGANSDGTVFSLPVAGGTPTTLTSFNGTNGANPHGNLTLSGSTLYGTTEAGGGAFNDGIIFSLSVAGGTPTTLATFNGTNGANPYGSLTLNGSTLYGTTFNGGANSDGTVFSILVLPEPSAGLALLCGFGMLMSFRRMRQV